jgi:acetate kinase
LNFLGIEIDDDANGRHAQRISADTGAVTVRVIRTDEETVIAALSIHLLGFEST